MTARILVAVAPPPAAGTAPAAEQRAPARTVIPFEGGELEVTTERERTAALVATVDMLQGRGGLFAVSDALRGTADAAGRRGTARLPVTRARITGLGPADTILDPAQAVADLWDDEIGRLDARTRQWLIRAEDQGREIVLARLRAGRADVLRERDRYLAGQPETTPDDRHLPLTGGKLTPRASGIRAFLVEVARRRIALAETTRQYLRSLQASGPPRRRADVEADRAVILGELAALQRYIAAAAQDSPLLTWLVDWDAEPILDRTGGGGTELQLFLRIRTVLRHCWDSNWSVVARMPAAPARAASADDPARQVADRIYDGATAGPWRFAPVMRQAVEDAGWSRSGPEAAAVGRVMANAGGPWTDSWAFAGGSFVVVTAVHALAPEVAVVADLMIAAYQLGVSFTQLGYRIDEYCAILDRRQALVAVPSANEVVANLIGLLIAPLDGAAALVANLIPAAIHAWPPDDPEPAP